MSKKVFIFLVLLLGVSNCTKFKVKKENYHPGKIVTLGLSSNGDKVISAGVNGGLLLWNIPSRSYRIISKHANPLSAYFIKGTNKFIWQDSKNIFHVQDTQGKEILTFSGKQSFGNVITSDLHYFFMTDFNWKFYRYDVKTKQWKILYNGYLGFINKPVNLKISKDEKKLLSSGFCGGKNDDVPINKPKSKLNLDCVVLWNIVTGKPIKKFWGGNGSTYATADKNFHYIVTGDENSHAYNYNATTGKKLTELDDIYLGRLVKVTDTGDFAKDFEWDKDGIKLPPKNYVSWDDSRGSTNTIAIKFLTPEQYLIINKFAHMAIFYNLRSRKPKKYLNLGEMPWPATDDYSRDGSIDTSIKTHTLVTGQASFDGINVYKFDPKTETLYRVWSPILNKPPTAPKSLSKDVPTLPGITFDQLSEVKRVDSYPKK